MAAHIDMLYETYRISLRSWLACWSWFSRLTLKRQNTVTQQNNHTAAVLFCSLIGSSKASSQVLLVVLSCPLALVVRCYPEQYKHTN